MDKEIRGILQDVTQAARRLLAQEYQEQLEGIYDIHPDGRIAPRPGEHLDAAQQLVRKKIISGISHEQANAPDMASAVQAYLREAAFTTLNRFVALKMLEARKLVQECVTRGEESSGFKEFCGLAPGLLTLPDHGYRLYLESLFDEIGTEVKILFDRDDPISLLWPRRQALLDLLAILNRPELATVWGEDETIGWVYQYFNSQEERREMREHAAPRNSHELAVRNQFFTPLYVVCFLSDNTLGRIWYEMRKGNTKLKELCKYLVRRPTEIFLKEGDKAPEAKADDKTEKSQEELLKEPVQIPHRKKKDPRDLKTLDPACGSGHFLLYCFFLLLAIYEEAWGDPESPASEVTGKTLREDYPTIEALRVAMPELILRHNLHGIDIDTRCAQIAALALWMRAQKAWTDMAVPRNQRPPVRKTNIVVAQPMPGEKDMLEEFISKHLSDTPEDKATGALLLKVFEHMKLAGEAGSLLKIEEAIKADIDAARKEWTKGQTIFDVEQLSLLGEKKTKQEKLALEFANVSEASFWEQAEKRIDEALKRYAEQARNGRRYQRRLFVEDAEAGFAFIDVCRKRYDVVLMNPPFGVCSLSSLAYVRNAYPIGYIDIYTSFIDRGCWLNCFGGILGAITSRTGFFLSSFEQWRRERLLGETQLMCCIDLGQGVLDGAMVETAAFTIAGGQKRASMLFFDLTRAVDKQEELEVSLKEMSDGVFLRTIEDLVQTPSATIAYSMAPELAEDFRSLPAINSKAKICRGSATSDDERFIRTIWEVGPEALMPSKVRRWRWLSKGGEFGAYYAPIHLVLDWKNDGDALGEFMYLKRPRNGRLWGPRSWSAEFIGTAGVVWPLRSQKGVSFRVLPADCAFSHKSPVVMSGDEATDFALLAILNTRRIQRLADCLTTFGSYEMGTIGALPVDLGEREGFTALGRAGYHLVRNAFAVLETDPNHTIPCRRELTSIRSLLGAQFAKLELWETELRQLLSDANTIYRGGMEEPDDRHQDALASIREENACNSIISELVGTVFGRWDVRYATGERPAPALPAPFAQLPVCPPGQLQNAQGLPAHPEDVPATYPIQNIPWDGILVDDPGHPADIDARIREVLTIIWNERADDIYREAVDILDTGAVDLRRWFRRSFFEDHIKRYSKSRRKAPIYWCLSTPSGSYAVWLYYHRFNKDTLYKVLNDYVKPKVVHEERQLTRLRQEGGANPTNSQRKEIEKQEIFVEELNAFCAEVARVAPLWDPDLNDGVIINFAPLWRLVGLRSWQKECKDCWDSLVAGEYDWANLAMHLWPERVIPKCQKDRSLAIAHDVQELFWEEEDGEWKPIKRTKDEIQDIAAERTSPAVKAALAELLEAPVATTGKKKRKKAE